MSIIDDFGDFGHRRNNSKGTVNNSFRSSVGGPPCPTCGTRNTAVIDSRPIDNGQKRRRKCLEKDSCPRWNTYETNFDPATLEKPSISKLDQSRVLRLIETAEALRKSLDISK